MSTRLVLLHIPKTAGTSFRETVKSVYGEDKMYWYGDAGYSLGSRLREYCYRRGLVAGKLILGGHKPLRFYPASADNVYCATVRDPVERAASLFSYYTRPDVAGSEVDSRQRDRLKARWLKKGIVPGSLLQSIDQCPAFRREIANLQCRYLSRGADTFEAACDTLARGTFLVGDSRGLPRIIDELGRLLGWPERREILGNRSTPGSNDDILQEEGVVERIGQLCAEDHKLYDFICQAHAGLYVNLPDRAALADSALHCADVDRRTFSRLAWGKVSIAAASQLVLPASGQAGLSVVVRNASRERLTRTGQYRVAVSYRLLDESGEVIPHEGIRTPLNSVLEPAGEYTADMRIDVPAALRSQVSTVRVSLMVEGQFWVCTICPGHGLDFDISG